MKFDFKKLENKIEEATKKAFQEMVAQHQSERIYAFALYSDEGAMTVCPATNTLNFLETQPENDLTYYKYEPAEWNYEGDGADDDFSEICNLLYDEVEDEKYEDDEELFGKFQQKLYQTCIDILLKLKNENYFKDIVGYDIFLIFSVTDYEQHRASLSQTISLLNENPYRDEYLNWMKTWKK
ncbi:DUF4303 domain-containing protein [Empedobacter sedimenti]|uniref:DUF4303 domain-containing protein n=1 Tax=Empedobacter sedimenti TaxID=3042610 RepID=UPI0024A6789D|nr:DUF4303 domain-containing protein [Empedobacter sedimenti]